MNKKTDKITFREALARNYRAYQILNKQCPKMFLSSLVCSVVGSITPYVGIYLSAQVINELAGRRNPEVLWRLVIITVVCTSLLALLNAVLSRWKNCRHAAFWYNQNKIYTDKMLTMDFCILDEQHTHDLRSHISQNQQWTGWGIGKLVGYFETTVNSMISIASAIALTFSVFTLGVPAESGKLTLLNHPVFAVAIISILLLVTFIAPVCSNKANSYWVKSADDAKMGNRFFSFFSFMAQDRHRALDIRMYNQQMICEHYSMKEKILTPGSKIAKYASGSMGILNAASEAIGTLLIGVVYVYVCLKAWAGAFGIGSVTQYITSITALSNGVAALIATIGDMRNNTAFLRTTYEFLDIPNKMYQGSLTTEKRADRNYEVEFCDVSFKYPSADSYALRHVSMKFKIGERLAVVGMNGSGKTTFIKLLCRLYDPTEGKILLNGIDIRKYKYDDYMSILSVVFQDFKLLAFPLGQNVASNQNYNKARVMDCLNKAGFSERLDEMANGLDTYLYKDFDEQGVEVSGGEAQKIAIARAHYKEAPFLILDEPTAALDPIAEAEIYRKFNEIVGDKTGIYISHRLSSCRFCDEIAVFDHGCIVQQGSHEQLVADESGKYYELWYAQAQYYK
ncbi:ABC transporter ATP-binding protein [Gorillibacterium timonense]|uniref:ABC transporter ATP-binding protein n=1 Tax=Gorillibacterium timonense TaxID=1689269 RepID=UPI00071D2289|nr:ABC transporter ATP-binding protein [Gorillibacterium timonense]